MSKKCGFCGETVEGGLLQCPKCGRGLFEAEGLQLKIHETERKGAPKREHQIKRRWLDKLFRRNSKPSINTQGALCGSEIDRFLKSFRPTTRLTYVGPHDSPYGLGPAIKIHPGHAGAIDVPSSDAIWPTYVPVIIPANNIAYFTDFANKDFRWWVIAGDQIRGFDNDMVLIVFDFDTPRPDRALVFGFTHADDAEWLHFMLKMEHVSILNGPTGHLIDSVMLDLSSHEFQISVQRWLSRFSGGDIKKRVNSVIDD